MKLKIHSAVDLITNSSTVIYTYSDGCESAVKAVVNEMLSIFCPDKVFDDLFWAAVLPDNLSDQIFDFVYENSTSELILKYPDLKSSDWKLREKAADKLIKNICLGVESLDDYFEITEDYGGSSLYLFAKDETYSALASKLTKFLYSPHHDGRYDG